MPRMLIAGDKFKGSASARTVAEALSRGIAAAAPEAEVVALPIADGGDGTIDAALAAGFVEHRSAVTGAYGERRDARFAVEPASGTAVIEVAEACGLRDVSAARLASAALDAGARSVVLGLGGSATSDGGLGMMRALGVRVLAADGAPIDRLDEAALRGATFDASGLDPRLAGLAVQIACDVTNPLTGPDGAAAVYGPQKGLAPEQVPEVDAALHLFGAMVERALGAEPGAWAEAPGAGAAGGLGFGALAVLGGEMRSGIDLVLDLVGFDDALVGADLVITSEGRLDAQTLSGKAPAGVLRRSREVPVVVVCGSSDLTAAEVRGAGFAEVYELVALEPDAAACIAAPEPLLEVIGRRIGTALRSG
ncbi:glycerate kinase [Leucobacter sp. GX0328]